MRVAAVFVSLDAKLAAFAIDDLPHQLERVRYARAKHLQIYSAQGLFCINDVLDTQRDCRVSVPS